MLTIFKLLHVLQRLVDSGNTVLVIEHNLDVVKTSDWVIDIGPGGGNKGGKIVATGTPEDVAKAKGSVTGEYLKAMLGKKVAAKAPATKGKKPPAKEGAAKKEVKKADSSKESPAKKKPVTKKAAAKKPSKPPTKKKPKSKNAA